MRVTYSRSAASRCAGLCGAFNIYFDVSLVYAKCADIFGTDDQSNDAEFAAFIAFSAAYPDLFIALLDTYDTLASGLSNYLAVSMALQMYGRISNIPSYCYQVSSGQTLWCSIR